MHEAPVRLVRTGGRAGQLKGRQVEDAALAQVRALIGEPPADGHPRDLLIEYLHRLNDRFHGLTPAHLAALAQDMRLGQAEVFEVASFYHHFELLPEGQAGAALTVRVCEGLSCEMAGARGPAGAAARLAGARASGWWPRPASAAASRRRRRPWGRPRCCRPRPRPSRQSPRRP